MSNKLHLIMPMAGGGTRFGKKGFQMPKPMIELEGKPFFFWAVQSMLKSVTVTDITFVVLSEHVKHYKIDDMIKAYYPEAKIVVIPKLLNGAVLTCMEGIRQIEDEEPILFNDCDHAFKCLDMEKIIKGSDKEIDGALLTFESSEDKYSYVKFDESGLVSGTVEKQAVSNAAICGAYYFKSKKIFLENAEAYLKQCSYSEFFMSGVYNIMVEKNLRVKSYKVNWHISFGTPEEYDIAAGSRELGELE